MQSECKYITKPMIWFTYAAMLKNELFLFFIYLYIDTNNWKLKVPGPYQAEFELFDYMKINNMYSQMYYIMKSNWKNT